MDFRRVCMHKYLCRFRSNCFAFVCNSRRFSQMLSINGCTLVSSINIYQLDGFAFAFAFGDCRFGSVCTIVATHSNHSSHLLHFVKLFDYKQTVSSVLEYISYTCCQQFHNLFYQLHYCYCFFRFKLLLITKTIWLLFFFPISVCTF